MVSCKECAAQPLTGVIHQHGAFRRRLKYIEPTG